MSTGNPIAVLLKSVAGSHGHHPEKQVETRRARYWSPAFCSEFELAGPHSRLRLSGSERRFGYSRDKRSDCVQMVIVLIVTPQGFPLAYEVMPGNTSDKTMPLDFLAKIEAQYGRSQRVWIMDPGIPTEETLAAMRSGGAPVRYLVSTPRTV